MKNPETDALEKVQLSTKENFIEGTITVLVLLMLIGFFLKIVLL